MPLFAVERQHPVGILPGFDGVAEPKMGGHRGGLTGDQEIRVAVDLGSKRQLRHPAQRLGRPSSRQHVDKQSIEYRDQCIAAAKRVRQPQRRVQRVPHLLRRPALECDPGGAQQGTQIHLAGVALRRGRQRGDQLQTLVEIRNRLGEGCARAPGCRPSAKAGSPSRAVSPRCSGMPIARARSPRCSGNGLRSRWRSCRAIPACAF